MGPGARLVALEIDPGLARLLEERFDDPRLQVVCDSAENLEEHLDGEPGRRPGLRPAVHLAGARAAAPHPGLAAARAGPRGVALVIQYSPLIQSELRRLFPSVRRRISLLNVPPAFLFACSQEPSGADADREPAWSAVGGERDDLVRGLQGGGRGERPLERALLPQLGAERATAGEGGAEAGHGGSFRLAAGGCGRGAGCVTSRTSRRG